MALGLVPGRCGAVVEAWLAAQPTAWRDGIAVVALDPSAPLAAAIRRLLLAAGDRLCTCGLARLRHLLAVNDPTEEIGAAWGIKELLCQLLAAPTAQDARQPLFRFYHAVLNADMPEITTLAGTISTWWPAIEAFLRPHVTNARTEGTNGTIKQIKRVGYSYHNQANY